MSAEHVSFPKDKPIVDLELIALMRELITACEWPDCESSFQLECCHVRARGMGGGRRKDTTDNMFLACREHHRGYDGYGQSRARQKWATENIIRVRPVWLQQTLQDFADREKP